MADIRCFIITPFHTDPTLFDAIYSTLLRYDIRVLLPDPNYIKGAAISLNEITDGIRLSDFLVVDISCDDPNVFYMLGFAHALRKPTILLAKSARSSIPSFISGYSLLVYDPSNFRILVPRLEEEVSYLLLRMRKQP